jgi:transposase
MPREQITLFATTLEDRIPGDHPVRLLDEILDRLEWGDWEKEYDSGHGQPPIHPKVLCKVLLFAMIRSIRSSRQIEYTLNHSIDFIWLASGHTIDHSTLSIFRTKHPDRLKNIYQQMVRHAVSLGAAKLSELCMDGTRIRANASRHGTWKAADIEKLIAELDREFEERLGQMGSADAIADLFDDGQAADKLPPDLADMRSRREELDAMLVDTAFSTGPNITAMEERSVELLSPLNEVDREDNPAERSDPTKPVADDELDGLPINPQTKRFDKSAFVYDEASDCYHCPAGKTLHRSDTETKQRASGPVKTTNYRCRDCAGCPLAQLCRKDVNAKSGRKVSRDVHEPARVRHRERMKNPVAKERYAQRLHFGETPFAVLKECFGLRRFLVRGHAKVRMEWLWGCTAFNLKKLTTFVGSVRPDSVPQAEPVAN